MKTLNLTFSILTIATMLIAGCTEKGAPVHRHEADRRPPAPAPATVLDPQTQTSAVTKDFNSLTERVLDETRIRDLKSYSNRNVRDELLAFNEKLVRTPIAERQALVPTLRRYYSVLRLECEDFKGTCLGLRYFKTAASSSEVVKMMAQMPEFADLAGSLLLFAVELKNGLADNDLLRLLIERVPPSTPTVVSMLETALMTASQNLREETKLREFLVHVKAWDLLENKKWDLSASAKSALWSMVGRARLLYTASGQLSPEFRQMSVGLATEAGSLIFDQRRIADKKLLKFEALGAQPIEALDDLYFLADAVFLQKISPDGALELFRSSRRPPADLAKMLENYVRLRFAVATADSNVAANSIFDANVVTEELFFHSLRQSSLVKLVWGTLATRLEILKSFGSSALKNEPALEAKFRGQLDSFDRSVSFSAVYPHTLLLFKILSTKRFKIRLRGMGEIDTGDLFPMLFHGSIPPLLRYSEEGKALTHFEVIHAFDMGVRSRLFQTMKVDPDEFMADVISRLNQKNFPLIETTLDRVDQRMTETRLWRDFESICSELKGGPVVTRTLDLPGIRRSPFYGRVVDVMFTGMSSRGSRGGGSGALSEAEAGLFYSDGEYAEALERVRLDLRQSERIAQAMLASYTGYLRKFENADEDEILKRTQKIRGQLDSMNRLRTRAIASSQNMWERAGWCYFKAGQKDYDTFNQVIHMEEEYLRGVHRDMTLLREGQLSAAEARRVSEQHQLTGMPGDFRGFDRIDKDAYTMSSVDFLIRAGRSAQKLAPNIRLNLGSKFDNDVELVREMSIRQVPYATSEQDFVEAGLKAIFAKRDPFSTWLTLAGGRIHMWQHYLKTMLTTYRMEMEVNGSSRVFTPRMILEAHEQVLRITTLTPDDRRLMNIIKSHLRFDTLYFDDRLLKFPINTDTGKFALQDVWSLYDLPVSLFGDEKLGFDYDQTHMGPEIIPAYLRPKRFGYLELGRVYYDSRTSNVRGEPIVPFNGDLDRDLDARVTATVRDGIRTTRALHETTKSYLSEVASRTGEDRVRADITIGQSINNLLSDNIIPSYDANLRIFRQATQDCFVKTCADFK